MSHVTVIDPRHELSGQRSELVSLCSARGPAFVEIALPDGGRRSIRRASTDLAAVGARAPEGEAEEGLRVSVRTLLALAQHLTALITASPQQVIPDGLTYRLDPGDRVSGGAAPAPLREPAGAAVAEPPARDASPDDTASGRASATDEPDAPAEPGEP